MFITVGFLHNVYYGIDYTTNAVIIEGFGPYPIMNDMVFEPFHDPSEPLDPTTYQAAMIILLADGVVDENGIFLLNDL